MFPVQTPSRVYISARGELNTLPLATFALLPEARGRSFVFLPFETDLSYAHTGVEKARMTLVAATRFGPASGLPALPEDQVNGEITAVRRAFADAAVLRGDAVTVRALEAAVRSATALHFTGHAAPWLGGAGLMVAPDPADTTADGRAGVWSMGRPRSLSAELVVLSACSTGSIQDTASVESGQLAAAILLAGSRQVVASLWDVDTSAANAWNQAFYAHIADGRSVAESAGFASNYLRGQSAWNNPKYWAGFAVYRH